MTIPAAAKPLVARVRSSWERHLGVRTFAVSIRTERNTPENVVHLFDSDVPWTDRARAEQADLLTKYPQIVVIETRKTRQSVGLVLSQ